VTVTTISAKDDNNSQCYYSAPIIKFIIARDSRVLSLWKHQPSDSGMTRLIVCGKGPLWRGDQRRPLGLCSQTWYAVCVVPVHRLCLSPYCEEMWFHTHLLSCRSTWQLLDYNILTYSQITQVLGFVNYSYAWRGSGLIPRPHEMGTWEN